MTSDPVFPSSDDPLGEVLHQLRLDGSLYCRSELQGDWSLEMPVLPGKMMFHIITSGECWLKVEGESPRQLTQRSLVLIPHGLGHVICSDQSLPSKSLFDAGVQKISERYEVLNIDGEGKKTELTCGVMSFAQVAAKQLIEELPSVLFLNQLDDTCDRWLTSTLAFISDEARVLKPGGETIITHLADILVIQLIRHWMMTSPQANKGWVGALRDKHIGLVLRAIHHEPC